MSTHPIEPDLEFDVKRRFIRIINERASGMVELEFAIGEPEIFVEMILPQAEFAEFCRAQDVIPTRGPLPETAISSPEQEWQWTLRDAREHHAQKPS